MTEEELDLVAGLTHELGVSLELGYSPHEFLLLWPEAVDLLHKAKVVLLANGRPVPGAVDTILNAARAGMS